jgi:ADP-ribose pyrophosphatase YjhB (NUDIX family)
MKWRPHPAIRVIALGLHWRGDSLLAVEILDDAGRIKGVRPLGGGVDFGETWQVALAREFQEELGLDVDVGAEAIVMENIYTHEGHTGHEVVFLAEVKFPDGAFAGETAIHFQEDNGDKCVARWFPLADLMSGAISLFPTGLKDRLLAMRDA